MTRPTPFPKSYDDLVFDGDGKPDLSTLKIKGL